MDQQKLQQCRDLLRQEEKLLLLRGEPEEEGDQKDLQVAKRYGGFMKRYGGFMSRRAATSAQPEDPEEHLGTEILQYLNAAAAAVKNQQEDREEGQGEEKLKRYGGFMRRDQPGQKEEVVDAEEIGRDINKRYGGFMRRVGRPEWLVDNSRGEKRAWENEGELHKRYGGFMD